MSTKPERADAISLSDLYHKSLAGVTLTAEEAEFVWSMHVEPKEYRLLITRLERELVKGIRCGVCGNTAEQSAEKGYDCVHEC